MKTEYAIPGKNPDFEQIYLFYYPKLVRFSEEYIFSKEDAENVVQDVFLAVWEQQNQLAMIENIPSYLFRITKNKCMDFLRHKITGNARKQELHDLQKKEWEYRLQAMEKFNTEFDRTELEKIITDAMESLPPRCKEIFVLSRMDGLNHQEIAERYKISASTVNNQIMYALKKLREKLKGHIYLYLLF